MPFSFCNTQIVWCIFSQELTKQLKTTYIFSIAGVNFHLIFALIISRINEQTKEN